MFLVGAFVFFFFKQKTAYEMRISDWSSDVCSSDLLIEDQSQGFMNVTALYADGDRTCLLQVPGIEEKIIVALALHLHQHRFKGRVLHPEVYALAVNRCRHVKGKHKR